MGLSDDGSYALIFCVTFLIVVCLTVVTAKIFDRTPPLPAGSYAPPFPDAAPLLPPLSPAPNQVGGCVSYCTNSATGQMEPCESVALKTCTDTSDCVDCMVKTPFQNIQCAAPTQAQWPNVQAQQAAMNNKSDKYCLPTRGTCLNLPDATPLQECNSDADCLRCNDALPNGEKFQCQPTKQNTVVNLAGKSVVAPYTASFCIPQYTGCDPQYGVATWTSDRQWKCECKYPNVMGGPACDQLVACNASELTPWSKDKQQLLLNMPGEDGSKVGDVWTIATGVDPNKCVGADGKQVECTGAATDVRTVACRCDGVHKGSLSTYTFTPGDPLTCTQDPCYASDFGTGKTWLYDATPGTAKNQLPAIPNLPVAPGPQCSCSGFGSGVWTYEAPKDNTDPTQGYKWKGYCQQVKIPGTSIVLPADADQGVCDAQQQANTDAQASLLIPSVKNGQAVCAVDPCTGLTSDRSYRTNIGITGSFGHFDAKAGTCLCSAVDGAVNIQIDPNTCDRTQNPACSYCANACIGGDKEIKTLCPVQEGSSCQPKCVTSSTGSKMCDCGQVPGGNPCFWYNGQCVEQKNFMGCCEDMHGVAGACAGKENSCRVVRSKSTAHGCSVSTQDYVKQAIVCDHRDQCGSGWCDVGGKGPTCKCGDAAGCTSAHFQGACGIDNPLN